MNYADFDGFLDGFLRPNQPSHHQTPPESGVDFRGPSSWAHTTKPHPMLHKQTYLSKLERPSVEDREYLCTNLGLVSTSVSSVLELTPPNSTRLANLWVGWSLAIYMCTSIHILAGLRFSTRRQRVPLSTTSWDHLTKLFPLPDAVNFNLYYLRGWEMGRDAVVHT